MGRRREIIKPPPKWLDNLLTLGFIASVVWIVTLFRNDVSSLKLLGGMIVVAGIVINLSKQIFRVFGLFLSKRLTALGDPLSKKRALRKWTEQSWQLVIHVAMTCFEIYILSDENWWQETKYAWIPVPKEQVPKPSLRYLYLAQLGIWIYTCFSHRFVEQYHNKDYVPMFVHHIATIILVGGSYWCGYHRIGLLVLFVHDISDIPIDFIKMVNLLKLEGRKGLYLSEIGYIATMFTWAYWRIWAFPRWVIRSALIESHLYVSGVPHAGDVTSLDFWKDFATGGPEAIPLYTAMNVLLMLLAALHVMWFSILARIGYKSLTKGTHEAGREVYVGDSDDEDAYAPSKHTNKPSVSVAETAAPSASDPQPVASVVTPRQRKSRKDD